MNPYLFAYSGLCSDEAAQDILNGTNAVITWVRPFPHAAILLSDLSLVDLSAVLHRRLGDTWFLVSSLGTNMADGWLPKELWNYVNHRPGTPAPMLPPAPAAPVHLDDAVAPSGQGLFRQSRQATESGRP